MSVVLGEGWVWAGADPGVLKKGGGHTMYCEMRWWEGGVPLPR